MEFTFDTKYDAKALTAMARAVRKTVRKKRSVRVHIFGWAVAALGVLLGAHDVLSDGFGPRAAVTWFAAAVIVAAFCLEDRLNGYIARKRMLPQIQRAKVTFTEENYRSETALGATDFRYGGILRIAETAEYFVFLFSASHAQIYDKRTLSGGTVEAFRAFLREKTGKDVEPVR